MFLGVPLVKLITDLMTQFFLFFSFFFTVMSVNQIIIKKNEKGLKLSL